MNSNLVPELRIDKNGKAVNRLVRPSAPHSQGHSPIPSLAALDGAGSPTGMSVEALMDGIKEGFTRHKSSIPVMTEEEIYEWGSDYRRKHLETWNRIASSFEYRDTVYFRRFLSGSLDSYNAEKNLIAAIESFEFCSAVEDSIPSITGRESRSMGAAVGRVISNFPNVPLSDAHIGDICASYFMERVGFDNDRSLGNVADFYRAMERVRLNLEVIKPKLPVILAVAAARVPNYGFSDIEELFTLIGKLDKYPQQATPLILDMVKDRGIFDENVVDRALVLGVAPMSSGVL